MSIFYTLLFVYITTPIAFELLPILIYFSWGVIVFNILLYILKIIFTGRPILCRIGTLFFNKKKIKISMERKGRTIDNIFIEGLSRSVKYDCVYVKCPEDGSELYTVLREYFAYYNDRLCHQGIDHQIPAHLYYQAA